MLTFIFTEISALEYDLNHCLTKQTWHKNSEASYKMSLETSEDKILQVKVSFKNELYKATKDLRGGSRSSIRFYQNGHLVEEAHCVNDESSCRRLRNKMMAFYKNIPVDEVTDEGMKCSLKVLKHSF